MLFGVGLGAHPVGRDEAVSLLLIAHPPVLILRLLSAHEVHPAGYFLMLWAWPHGNLVAARLLSWLAAVAVIPLLHLAAGHFGLRRPWLAGLLAATSPFLGYYAAEARMYSWLALFGAAALLAVAAWPERPGWRWGVGLGLLAAAGIQIHYFAAFTVIGLLLVMVARRELRLAAITAVTAVILFLPGLALLGSQLPVFLRYPGEAWQERLTPTGLLAVAGLLFGGAEYQEWGRRAALLLAVPALYGLSRAPRRLVLLVAGSLLLPLVAGVFTTSLSARYLAAGVPALLLCLALAIDTLPSRLFAAGAAAACAVGLGLIAYADLRVDPVKPPTPQLLRMARAQGALYVVNHRHFAPQAAYYAPGAEAFAFPSPKVDHVGLWAVPPGLPYPPADRRPLLVVDYCGGRLELPAGYRADPPLKYPNELCVTVARGS